MTDTQEPGDRRPVLRQAKLRALVADRWGAPDGGVAGLVPGGATLHTPGSCRGWVLVDDGSVASFGAALAWAQHTGVGDLHLLVEDAHPASDGTAPSGVMARRARQLRPAPSVWLMSGRSLAPVEPVPPAPDQPLPANAADVAATLRAHGVDPVIEHGVLIGEVLGLEIARLTCGVNGWGLEVGVGRHDRAARAELRPGQSTDSALDETVSLVRARRRAGAGPHPANVLARERWLRASAIRHPELVGLPGAVLHALPTALPRLDIRRPMPAPAGGVDATGRTVLVVCSTGVDVDLVPSAADCRLLHAPSARAVLAVPVGDDYPVTRRLAAWLDPPGEVVTVPADWARYATN